MKKYAFILVIMMSLSVVSCKSIKGTSAQSTEKQKLQEQLDSKNKEIKSLQEELKRCRSRLAVYQFFNDNDITIFSNDAIEKIGGVDRLKGKVRTKYETIRMIADVEHRLTETDRKIQQLRQQQQSKRWSDAELRNAVRLEIKADMEIIAAQLDDIDKRDLSDFSEIQRDYYKKQSQRYDDIESRYLY